MKRFIVIGFLALGFTASANMCSDFTHVPQTNDIDYSVAFSQIENEVNVVVNSSDVIAYSSDVVLVSELSGIVKSKVGFLSPPRGDDVNCTDDYLCYHYNPPNDRLKSTSRRSRDGLEIHAEI